MRSALFGFGLERLGLWASRRPALALVLLALVTGLAIAGLPRLGFNSDIREVFRASGASSGTLDRATEAFGASEHDLFVVVEGADLFTPQRLTAIRDFALDLRLIDGVSGVVSMFSARSAPAPDGSSSDVFPLRIGDAEDMAALRAQVTAHPLVHGKLVSDDGKLALLLVTLSDEATALGETRRVIAEIAETAKTALVPAGIGQSITGFPAIRSTIVGILTSDQLIFKAAAFSLSILLSGLYFLSFRYLLLAVLPSAIAATWLLGAMGWAGEQITVVTNVVPSLVMVITFSNAVHLLLAIRRERIAGKTCRNALEEAVRAIGPATAMTALTTAVALSSLIFVGRPSITSFGLTAALGAAIGCLIALTLIPSLAYFVLGEPDADKEAARAKAGLSKWIQTASDKTARLVLARPGTITVCAIAVLAVCGALYFLNQPQFRYGTNLPQKTEVAQTAQRIDSELAGSSVVQLLIELPDTAALVPPETLRIVADAHAALASEPLIREVWSLDAVARWYRGNGRTDADLLREMQKPEATLFSRLVNRKKNLALVTGYLPDLEAATLLALEQRLEPGLEALRQKYPDARFDLTGIALHSAHAATDMIHMLSRSLLIAIALIVVLIGLSLRSLAYGALTVLPNLLPISVAGAYLYLSGQQLQFTSIIIFTISFGIAVDSTIHVLNHYRATRADFTGWQGAVSGTVRTLGPALILATLALMAGGVTILSPLPMAQLYGKLILQVLTAALIGDILFLPALIAVMERWRRKPA